MWSKEYTDNYDRIKPKDIQGYNCSANLQTVDIDLNGRFRYRDTPLNDQNCTGQGVIRINELKIRYSPEFKVVIISNLLI